jgi:hypothetical protein
VGYHRKKKKREEEEEEEAFLSGNIDETRYLI